MFTYLMLALLLIIAALLFTPLRFRAQGRITEDISVELGLAWAGGLVSARWYFPQPEKPPVTVKVGPWGKAKDQSKSSQQVKSAVRKDKPPQAKSSQKSDWEVIRAVLDWRVLREMMSILSNIWHSLQLCCDLEGDYGTDDPASTAYIASFIAMLNHSGQKQRIKLQPQFDQAGVNINGVLNGRLVPGIILLDLARFMLKRPIRKIWWTILTQRNKK